MMIEYDGCCLGCCPSEVLLRTSVLATQGWVQDRWEIGLCARIQCLVCLRFPSLHQDTQTIALLGI